MNEIKINVWKYKCKDCNFITYIPVGYGFDVICHKCYSYNIKCLGKDKVSQLESLNKEIIKG